MVAGQHIEIKPRVKTFNTNFIKMSKSPSHVKRDSYGIARDNDEIRDQYLKK